MKMPDTPLPRQVLKNKNADTYECLSARERIRPVIALSFVLLLQIQSQHMEAC